MRQSYVIEKASEGGITIKDAKVTARAAGLTKIATFDSIYVGKFCLSADGTEQQHRKFEETLWPEN